MRVLLNTEKQNMTAIQKSNERAHQNLRAQLDRIRIFRQEEKANATAQVSVSKTDAESKTSVAVAQAESNKSVAESQGRQKFEELVGQIKIDCAAKLVNAEQAAKALIIASQAQVEAAKARAETIKSQADVEGDHSAHYAELRQFEYQLKRQTVMAKLATKGKFVVSGDAGDSILQQLCPGTMTDMVTKKATVARLASIDANHP